MMKCYMTRYSKIALLTVLSFGVKMVQSWVLDKLREQNLL